MKQKIEGGKKKEEYYGVLYHTGQLGDGVIQLDYISPCYEYPYLAGSKCREKAKNLGNEKSGVSDAWYVSGGDYKIRLISTFLGIRYEDFFKKNTGLLFNKLGII